MTAMLDVTDLSTHIAISRGVVQAVGNVDLRVDAGETLGIVGESGCGKSMTGLSIMGLLPPGGSIVGGSITLDGRELVGLPAAELRKVRGNEVAMIFQDPLTSLDPTKTIGYQVAEPVRLHRGASPRAALERAVEVLDLVGLPRPRERLGDYPHQLSGGLRQRVMIAMALSCEPKVLIADEPTTALDVTIQAQILTLLDDLKQRLGMAMLLVTHDMGVIAGHADRVAVMYAGHVVETAEAGELFRSMRHPYTQALLAAIPRLTQNRAQALHAIPGLPPDLANPPTGCRFAPRCARATDKCRSDEPPLAGATAAHLVSCWHPVRGPLPASADGQAATGVPVLGDIPGETPPGEAVVEAPAADVAAGAEHAATTEGTPGVVGHAEAPTGRGPDAGPASSPAPEAAPAAEASTVAVPQPRKRLAAIRDRGANRGPKSTGTSDGGPMLEVRDVVKEYPVSGGTLLKGRAATVKAVSGVSFSVPAGETFGLVGESGCGKSTLARLLVALERPDSGSVVLDGKVISKLGGGALRKLRRDLQLMFQDPYSSLDPRMRVGSIIREPLAVQHIGSAHEQRERVFELLSEVGLAREAVERYPHEFSGGQRQRIGLARALAARPRVVVTDEPVSALDVSIQAQVLNLMRRLQDTYGLTYVVISHDLSVVRYLARHIGVMYLGKMVEIGSADDVYQRAAHPYTAGLIAAVPMPEPEAATAKSRSGVRGELPSSVNPPSGCRFRTRCPLAQAICAEQEPPLRPFGPGHVAACHFPLRTPATVPVPATAAVPATVPAAAESEA